MAVRIGSVKVGEDNGILLEQLVDEAEQEATSNGGTMNIGPHVQPDPDPILIEADCVFYETQRDDGSGPILGVHNEVELVAHSIKCGDGPTNAFMDIDPLYLLVEGDNQVDSIHALSERGCPT
ncbi:piezo-type mechanosensitive ion channel component 2-like [Sesbania bispinosa]|nr:piezo-type mechanosensitive ion channel component 2-like [Sesbania bispinosa]